MDSVMNMRLFEPEVALERFCQRSSWSLVYLPCLSLLGDEDAIRAFLTSFLLHRCEIGTLKLPDRELGRIEDFVPGAELVRVAATGATQIEQITCPSNFPPDLLDCFLENPNLRRILLQFRSFWSSIEPLYLQKSRRLVRAYPAQLEVGAQFNDIASWNTAVWLALASDIANIGTFTFLAFPSGADLNGEVNEQLMKELLPKDKHRKLSLSGTIRFSEKVMEIVATSVDELEIKTNCLGSYFLLQHLIEYAPQMTSVKVLKCEVRFYDNVRANRWKRQILEAFWWNRSLTEKIDLKIIYAEPFVGQHVRGRIGNTHIDIDLIGETNRMFLEDIVQRNRHLPLMLEDINQLSLAPHLLQVCDVSFNTPDEMFTALRKNLPSLLTRAAGGPRVARFRRSARLASRRPWRQRERAIPQLLAGIV